MTIPRDPDESESTMSTDQSALTAQRFEVGVLHQGGKAHHVVACRDRQSVWVEICGPNGGRSWELAIDPALRLADLLTVAAGRARTM